MGWRVFYVVSYVDHKYRSGHHLIYLSIYLNRERLLVVLKEEEIPQACRKAHAFMPIRDGVYIYNEKSLQAYYSNSAYES